MSHTCTGSNLTLVVVVTRSDPTLDNPSVTYNGVAMTFAGRERNNTGSNSAYMYIMINPPTGAHNIVVSTTSFSAQFSASYTGTRQTTQPDAETGESDYTFDTTLTKSITTTVTDPWVIFFPLLGTSRTLSPGTNTTARIVDANGSFSGYPCGIYDTNAAQGAPGSKSMQVTCASGTTQACHILLSLAPPSTDLATTLPTMNVDVNMQAILSHIYRSITATLPTMNININMPSLAETIVQRFTNLVKHVTTWVNRDKSN
jgi:hypothetical protein